MIPSGSTTRSMGSPDFQKSLAFAKGLAIALALGGVGMMLIELDVVNGVALGAGLTVFALIVGSIAEAWAN